MRSKNLLPIIKMATALLCCLVFLYGVVGFYVLPKLIKIKLPELILKETGRNASLEQMHFNPFTLQASLKGFQINTQDDQQFIGFEAFSVQVNALQSISNASLVIDQVLLEKFSAQIVKNKDGKLNFSELIKPSTEPEQPERGLFPILVKKLSIKDGKINWLDKTLEKPVNEVLQDINITLDDFTTRSNTAFDMAFSLVLQSGGKLDWQGNLGISPIVSEGHLKLENISLKQTQALVLHNEFTFKINGTANLDADYALAIIENEVKAKVKGIKLQLRGLEYSDSVQHKAVINIPTLSIAAAGQLSQGNDALDLTLEKGMISLQNFELSEDAKIPALIKIADLSLADIALNLKQQQINIGLVSTKDAEIKAWLTEQGINYQSLFYVEPLRNESSAVSVVPAKQPTSKTWAVKIDDIKVSNYKVDFQDLTQKQPSQFNFSAIDLQLKGYNSLESASNMPVGFAAVLNDSSQISLKGDVQATPAKLMLAIALKDLNLNYFQHYVDDYVRLNILEGKLAIDGDLGLDFSNAQLPGITFKGNSQVSNLITRDQLLNKDFIKWDKLLISAIDADLQKQRYHAGGIVIEKPYARIIIEKDKSNNFNDVVIASKPGKKSISVKKPVVANQPEPDLSIGSIKINQGSSDFADLSLILPFAAKITGLDGGIKGFSSAKQAKLNLALKGSAYDLAPVAINGDYSPGSGDLNVALDFKGIPMPLMSPYMVQFAGYKVEKGKLSLTLNYNITKSQLTASNNILIDQFELGEKIENPNAVSLPMELAVALLKGSDGKIKIDVPVTGSLEDPKFDIGSLIVDALLNSIGKVVSAPFNAIASLIGSDEDLSHVSFKAGKAELTDTETQKLKDLAKVLLEKPELQLEIKGAAFEKQDWDSLADAALYDQLREIKVSEINKEGVKTRLENVELSDDDYKRLLTKVFLEKFPLLAEKSFLGTPKLLDPNAGDFYTVAREKLSATIAPEPKRLNELAAERAQTIAKFIVQQGGLPNDRVFILDTVLDPPRQNAEEIVTNLSLKAN
ncbi:MAG: DUF748 domain-containing protein [Methylococcaceae bacterium]|jgi:hypothetical protein